MKRLQWQRGAYFYYDRCPVFRQKFTRLLPCERGESPYNLGMLFDQITIVGVGLIGGSVGLAAKTRGVARRVVGVDRDSRCAARSFEVGAVDAATTSLRQGMESADLVVVCTPVDRIAEVILGAIPHAGRDVTFTDAGSVKGGLHAAVRTALGDRMSYVPAHPLAGRGKERRRTRPRRPLRESRYDHHPVRSARRSEPRSIGSRRSGRALGAWVVRMNADEHDRVLAVTSHLPHAIASAVAGVTPRNLLAQLRRRVSVMSSQRIAVRRSATVGLRSFEANRDEAFSPH